MLCEVSAIAEGAVGGRPAQSGCRQCTNRHEIIRISYIDFFSGKRANGNTTRNLHRAVDKMAIGQMLQLDAFALVGEKIR